MSREKGGKRVVTHFFLEFLLTKLGPCFPFRRHGGVKTANMDGIWDIGAVVIAPGLQNGDGSGGSGVVRLSAGFLPGVFLPGGFSRVNRVPAASRENSLFNE